MTVAILLEQEQKDLLVALVKAVRTLPEGHREKFLSISYHGDDRTETVIRHPGLPSDFTNIYEGHIETLTRKGLLSGRSHKDTFAFDVTPEGFAYCDALEHQSHEDTARMLTPGEAKFAVLEALLFLREPTSADYISDTEIAEATKLSVHDVRGYLDLLEDERLIESANDRDGYSAIISNRGRTAAREWKQRQAQNQVTVADPYERYVSGIRQLLDRLGMEHSRYMDALNLEHRLMENLHLMKFHGDTETRRADRSVVIHELNQLAIETLQTSFNDLMKP